MTISIIGNRGEFYCNVVINGENGSVVMQDADGIIVRQGKVTIKGDDKDMVKTKIIKTTEKYDKDGKLVEKITREETTEDDETRSYTTPIISSNPWTVPTPVPCCRDNTKLQCAR